MPRPIIALLTDFGLRDHYVGVMKGVVLGICPDATLVDIAHDLPPHDVRTATLELAAAYRYFPVGTIFLVVVDPGVGSSRRGLAVDVGDYRFVAPDNGVLTAVLDESPAKRIVELTDRKYARPTMSRTFEGRDRFAPAAAWLAKGTAMTAFGRAVPDSVRVALPRPSVDGERLTGEVVRVDRFGNVITNIDRRAFDRFVGGRPMAVSVGGQEIARLVNTYADAEPRSLCALFGSSEHLEVAANGGDAASRLGVSIGAQVTVTLG